MTTTTTFLLLFLLCSLLAVTAQEQEQTGAAVIPPVAQRRQLNGKPAGSATHAPTKAPKSTKSAKSCPYPAPPSTPPGYNTFESTFAMEGETIVSSSSGSSGSIGSGSRSSKDDMMIIDFDALAEALPVAYNRLIQDFENPDGIAMADAVIADMNGNPLRGRRALQSSFFFFVSAAGTCPFCPSNTKFTNDVTGGGTTTRATTRATTTTRILNRELYGKDGSESGKSPKTKKSKSVKSPKSTSSEELLPGVPNEEELRGAYNDAIRECVRNVNIVDVDEQDN